MEGGFYMIIKAGELKKGTQLTGLNDSLAFKIDEIIKESEKTITVRICPDFSNISGESTTRKDGTTQGIIKTFRKSTKLYSVD